MLLLNVNLTILIILLLYTNKKVKTDILIKKNEVVSRDVQELSDFEVLCFWVEVGNFEVADFPTNKVSQLRGRKNFVDQAKLATKF